MIFLCSAAENLSPVSPSSYLYSSAASRFSRLLWKMASLSYSLLLFSFFHLAITADLVLEDGYVVTTVIDGHKLHVNPYAVVAPPGSSDLIVLDSSGSSFYTVSFPLSQESVVRRLAGDGSPGHVDGEAGHARFNKPRSFAADAKGNLYVADRNNGAIRKISSSSGAVTTIAGGYTKPKEIGHRDGPAQNATFSSDFEITFISQGCSLLVSDHGNMLVRQINLKEEDCVESSHSAVGTVSVWAVGLLVSCFLGIAVGIVVRPYIIPREGANLLCFPEIWKHYLTNLGKQLLTLFFGIRNEAAKLKVYSMLRRLFWLILSHLLLMFRITNVNHVIPPRKTVSLHVSDTLSSSEVKSSEKIFHDLKDLITFDDVSESSDVSCNVPSETLDQQKKELSSHPQGSIDRIMQAHIDGFAKSAGENTLAVSSSVGSPGLLKRRLK